MVFSVQIIPPLSVYSPKTSAVPFPRVTPGMLATAVGYNTCTWFLIPFSHCRLSFLGNISPFVWIHKHVYNFLCSKWTAFLFYGNTNAFKRWMSRSTFFVIVVSFVLLWIFFIIVSLSLKNRGKKTQSFSPHVHNCWIRMWIKQASWVLAMIQNAITCQMVVKESCFIYLFHI